MKRIQEKVKDLIDVRPYEVIQDFISDPAQTLAIYHFTDITSDMMAQWLDKVSNVDAGSGSANALAGYRGVGKSHFLATLGAIISQPELRSRISDSHVAASAQRLKRKRHPVAYVRRGIFDSFIDELRAAIAKVLDIDVTPVETLSDLLHLASEKAEDIPFVLIIDTAFERSARVSRDDGQILGEIAEISKDLNMFVGVALDDDIAGADGANAAITRTYAIDYLDQEHLYKIVNNYIFPKHRQTLPLLHDIYNDFRKMLPSFRWSEQRFISLYPLHPVTLEIAPYVRLYAQDFALLSFTSAAGGKIMGRPANSLIALDEVFDSVESSLRKVADLKDAFAAYDKLNADVVSQIPIMQRMQAKLILKGLLLLSLDGYGTTVGEICAAMLIFDEEEPGKSDERVKGLLETFLSAFPENIERVEEDGRETRYSLKISNKEDLNNTLADAIKHISRGVIPKILRRVARDKFPEWILPNENEPQRGDISDCYVEWRGGLRRGRIVWNLDSETHPESQNIEGSEAYDWEVVVDPNASKESATGSKIIWQPAPIREDEAETILRYFVLLTNVKLREEFGEFWQAAGHTHTVNVEKIWHRLFIQDSKFIIDSNEYAISDEAGSILTLSHLLSTMLEPHFEARYSSHPVFAEPLVMNEVAGLVKDFFSGARQTGSDIQKAVETFAFPLGLVTKRGDTFVHESEENILKLPLVQEVSEMIRSNPGGSVSLKDVSQRLRKIPFGLMREAQYLILSALVAHRQIEFVTSKGDRISRRSLDLNIIWDDIVGIAAPTGTVYGSKRLTDWAKLLTKSDNFHSIDNPDDQLVIRDALETWRNEWESKDILSRFNDLPDDIFNTQIWRFSKSSQKTFGGVAGAIRELLSDTIPLEECLLRIADSFSDSEQVFEACQSDFRVLEEFVNTVDLRNEITGYLVVCGATGNIELEELRERILGVIDRISFEHDKNLRGELVELWESFRSRYTDYFSVNHDALMKSHLLQERFDEIRRSDEWWEFENLSKMTLFPKSFGKNVTAICKQFKELNCRFDVKEMLKTHPFCACSFSLSEMERWESLPESLIEELNAARAAYRNVLRKAAKVLSAAAESAAQKNRSNEFASALQSLMNAIGNGSNATLGTDQIAVLREISGEIDNSARKEISKLINSREESDDETFQLPLIGGEVLNI